MQCCLLANLNSLILDYIARQKVGNVNLNFYLIEQFPMIPPDFYAQRCPWNRRMTLEKYISDRVIKLTCTSDDMRPLAEEVGFAKGVHKWNATERSTLLAQLDAAYFVLYQIRREDIEYIFTTFSAKSDVNEDLFGGENRAKKILKYYDQFTEKMSA